MFSIQELQRTETANITKKGYLKFINTQTNRETRIFTQTNDKSAIGNIGSIVCAEMRFNKFLNAKAVLVSDTLKTQYSADDYLDYVGNQNLNGLVCNGQETSVKDCLVTLDATLDTPLYELEIECLCILFRLTLCMLDFVKEH